MPTDCTFASFDILLTNVPSPIAAITPTCANERTTVPPLLATRCAASAGSVLDLNTTR
jgi:hypothetical protein